MRKLYRSLLWSGLVAAGVAACGDDVTVTPPPPPPPPPAPTVHSVSVTPDQASVQVGGTLTMIASVNADATVATTVTWSTSDGTLATIGASTGVLTAVAAGDVGVRACSTVNTSVCGDATVHVTTAPVPTVVSVGVTPSVTSISLNTVTPATLQLTAAVVGANAPSQVVTWQASPNPLIATVSTGLSSTAGTGLVTVPTNSAGGTVVITACSTVPNYTNVCGSSSITVNVGRAASISINSVTAGGGTPGAGLPVTLNNVAGQIDVNLNFDPGDRNIDSIRISLLRGTVFLTAGKQNFGGNHPAAGLITLSVNTANFTKTRATGVARVDWFNGPTTLTAQVFPTGTGATGAVNCQIAANDPTCASPLAMVFNNIDGWAGEITKCSNVIADGVVCPAAVPGVGGATGTGGFAIDVGGSGFNTGKTYWGGPGVTGQITAELYAVVYNDNPANAPGSTLNRCNNQNGDGTGCISNVNWTIGSTFATCPVVSMSATVAPATPLFVQTFGTSGAGLTNNCATHQNILTHRDNIVVMGGALDAQNNNYPSGPLIPNTTVFGATPDSMRLDWAAPGFVAQPFVAGAENFNWVNAIWPFNPGGTLVTDNGVGPAPATWQAFASLNGGSASTFPTPIATGNDLAETNQNCAGAGCDGYNAQATAQDLLGNANTSGVTASFGDDRTAPMVRYSAIAAPSLYASIYTAGGSGAKLDSTTYNAIEGVYGANVVTAGAQTLFLAAAAGTNDSVRIEALDNRSGLSRAIENTRRFAQGGATGTVSSVYSTTAGTFGAATIDGWLPALALHATNGRAGGAPPANPGYYTTTEYVVDKAGNVSGCPITGNILGANGVASICTAAAPSFTAGTNSAYLVVGANEFFRRTLALDPAQPAVTGVSPNNNYTGNSSQTFTLGSQNDLEVVDARLRIQYPNLTIGDAGATASPGLVWSYALSNTFMSGGFNAGPASGNGNNFGYFAPIGTRFDASIINPSLTPLVLDQFTLDVQETCLGAASPTATCAVNGDPIPQADVDYTLKAVVSPINVAVQVRDVFGSWIFNTTAGAATGVSAEFVSPILSFTVAAPGGYTVTYYNAGALTSCPQGGVVQPVNSVSCVNTGINFRAEPSLSVAATTEVFRETASLSVTLPTFSRVDLFGHNAANEWVFVQRCTIPASITPNGSAQGCGGGTVTGTDNGNERYWLYAFTGVTGGFDQYRAVGVNSSGFGLASTRQP